MRRHVRAIAAQRTAIALLAGLVAAALAVGAYVLVHQRIVFPWQDTYELRAELVSAKGFQPGQGQSVDVSGVAVGQITDVRLRDGRAIVTMVIDRHELAHVYRDARVLVRPKTALDDMSLALDPGTPRAGAVPDGGLLPAARTAPTVDPDEVLAALDGDARTYLQALLDAGARGIRGRGAQLRAVLKATAPTLRRTHRIASVLRARNRELARLVFNLRRVAASAAPAQRDLADLVTTSSATFRTLATQDASIRAGAAALPATLGEAQRSLDATAALSGQLAPALQRLMPALRGLAPALQRTRPLLRAATPALAAGVRPAVRAARPAARDLRATIADLAAGTPTLTKVFGTLTALTNELAHEPAGPRRSYLFWLAWFAQNGNSTLSTGDATGAVYRALSIFTCPAVRAGQPDPVAALIDALPICSQKGR